MKRWPILLTCVLIGACTSEQRVSPPVPVDSVISWPVASPQHVKIKYVSAFNTSEDLGIRPSAINRLINAIAGEKETGMLRPYSISVYKQAILVGDPGKNSIHLFDQSKRKYRQISEVDSEHLQSPVGVALSDEKMFVADSVLGKVFILDYNGKLLAQVSDLIRPTGLAFDTAARRLYVADTLAHKIVVYDELGRQLFNFGNRGSGESEFNFPSHISLANGKLLVNDTMNFRVQVFDLDGDFLHSFGKHGNGSGYFSQPKGIAADSTGNIYVSGATIDRVQIFSPDGRFLLAFGDSGNNPGDFQMPAGITILNDMIYVTDSFNQRVQIFQYMGEN